MTGRQDAVQQDPGGDRRGLGGMGVGGFVQKMETRGQGSPMVGPKSDRSTRSEHDYPNGMDV